MERFKGITIIFLLAFAVLASAAQTKSASVLLQEGLYAEEIEGNLDAAINIYRQVIAESEEMRQTAAQATYRIAMCYLKKGEKAEAARELRTVLSKFPQQQSLIKEAQKQLAKLEPPAGFGPVIERLVNDDGVGKDFLLDLDTGRLYSASDAKKWSETSGAGQEKSLEDFIMESGVDLFGETSKKSLMGIDMIAMPTHNERWNMSPEDVIEQVSLGKPGTPVALSADGELPKTFVFKTGQGGVGILQITEMQDGKAPRHFKIRYKMLQKAERTAPNEVLGPVIELVIYSQATGKPFFFDLDTGQAFYPPAGLTRHSPAKEVIEWSRTKGIDIVNDRGRLELAEMTAVKVVSSLWESATRAEIRDVLMKGPTKKMIPTHSKDYAISSPITYAFETRENGAGVLQILEKEDENIRIRYKTLQPKPEKPSEIVVRRVWADAADPKFTGAPSPDGKYLSYVDWETGDLAIHELATGNNRRLTSEGWEKGWAQHSVFSPDSKYVACRWRSRRGGGLRIIRLDGSERCFIKHPEGITILRPTDWSSDGKHILALGGAMWDDSEGSFRFLKILFVSVEDDDVRVLKTIERLPHRKRPGQFRMSLSPDGRYVAYSFPPADNSGNGDIWLFGTDGGLEIQVVEHLADDFVLGWAPDGKRVVFASDRTGSMGIWAVEVADGKAQGTPQLLTPEIGRFHPLGLTQSGSFYYGVYSGGNNVYTVAYDPQKGDVASKPIIAVHRYEGSNWAPDWSPDGRHLACVSVRPDASPVFLIHSVETGEVRELSPDLTTFNVHSLRWAPDGRSLLGAGKTKDVSWGVLKIDVETGAVTTIVEGPGIFGPNWAADCKAVFYVCNLKTSGGIIRHDLATGEKKELYRASGFIGAALALSPDGRQLAFYDIQGGALKVVSATGGEPRGLVKVEGKISIAWTPDGHQLVYESRGLDEEPAQLWRIPAEGGETQRLGLEMPYLGHVRFHPDGQQITFVGESQKEKVEVWVMENFLPELNDRQ